MTRRKPPKKHTLHALAVAAGVSDRHVARLRDRGLPMPRRGESLAAWGLRARTWIDRQRGRPGPRSRDLDAEADNPETQAHFLRRWRKARAIREELLLTEELDAVHTPPRCRAEQEQRVAALTEHFRHLPSHLAQACTGLESDLICRAATEILRSTFGDLQGVIAEMRFRDDAPAVTAPSRRRRGKQDLPESKPHSHAAYNRRWRKARALREELALQRKLSQVHDKPTCHAEQTQRLSALMRHFVQMPTELGRACVDQGAEEIARVATMLMQAAFAPLQQAIADLPCDAAPAEAAS